MKKDYQQEKVLSDEEIISMYWNRNEQAIVETDPIFPTQCLKIAPIWHLLPLEMVLIALEIDRSMVVPA